MRNIYTGRQVNLMNQLRRVWTQHVYWTRSFIVSTVGELGDLQAVTNRLLENPGDLAKALAPFYPPKFTDQLKNLFTEHLLIAADFVTVVGVSDK